MNDADWVEDVKRWYLAGARPSAAASASGGDTGYDIGYEAAHPALLAHHWPDAPACEFVETA